MSADSATSTPQKRSQPHYPERPLRKWPRSNQFVRNIVCSYRSETPIKANIEIRSHNPQRPLRHRLQTCLTTCAPFPFLFSIVFMPKTRFRKNISASRTPALLPVPFVKERAESRNAF